MASLVPSDDDYHTLVLRVVDRRESLPYVLQTLPPTLHCPVPPGANSHHVTPFPNSQVVPAGARQVNVRKLSDLLRRHITKQEHVKRGALSRYGLPTPACFQMRQMASSIYVRVCSWRHL